MPTNNVKPESPVICPYCKKAFVPQVRSTIVEDDLQNRFAILTVVCEDCHKVISAHPIPMMN